MSLYGYTPKHAGNALWRTTPSGRRQAAQEVERAAARRLTRQRAASAQRRPVRRVSSQKSKRDRIYNARVKVWLKEIGNTFCHCCIARDPVKRPNLSTNCHHLFGRGWRNELLMIEKYWIPCCSTCHPNWIDANMELAREIGMLAPKGQWNQPPKDL